MQGVTGPVIVEILDDGVHVRVVVPLTYTDSKGRVWVVPADFVSDGISLPVWAYTALDMTPFTTCARVPAILHDRLYATPGMDKGEADILLREAAIWCGLPTWQADVVYAGVHIGGESSFTADQAIAAAKAGALSPAT